MERTWVEEIITWPSPRREDDGVSLFRRLGPLSLQQLKHQWAVQTVLQKLLVGL